MSAAENRTPARQAAKEPQAQSTAAPSPFPSIADYAFLSNCHTGAPQGDHPAAQAWRTCHSADRGNRQDLFRGHRSRRRFWPVSCREPDCESNDIPSPRDPFGSDHARAISPRPSSARSIDATTFNALGSMSSTREGVSWSSKTRPRPSAQGGPRALTLARRESGDLS
jgi:hypothetical protein